MILNDIEYLRETIITDGFFGSDSSLANLVLLEPKYNIKIHIKKDFVLRQYFGENNRLGFAFPYKVKKSSADYLKNAVDYIISQADKNTTINFCLCTSEQKEEINKTFEKYFPSFKIDWKTTRDDCDYIYLREKLDKLSGTILQKKKNHVSRFMRTYENLWEYKQFPQNNIADDILQVEEDWYSERSNDVEKAFDDYSLTLEKESIKIAVQNAELLGLTGGVIYVNQKPVAMCLASPISEDVIDVHFEKVLSEFAQNGGYATINNLFAKNCNQLYINREEDMGVEGLRHAKLSYKPEILLDKFYGKIIKC